MKFFAVPVFIQKLFPGLVWHVKVHDKRIFLTFDDGPIPDATPEILSILDKFQIKATFFCVGQNVEKYPEIYQKIIHEGHSTGNHTFNHLNGRQVKDSVYLANIEEAGRKIKSNLFRPPYGKIRLSQFKKLREKGIKVIMWSCLTYDFDLSVSDEKILKKAFQCIRPGGIIVFHDHLKTIGRLKKILPLFITEILARGYQFDILSDNI